jgi:two-component system OmpR family sensor kinase
LARLFLSLYLFIALSLVSLSASLDRVFFNDAMQIEPEAKTLALLIARLSENGLNVSELAQDSELSLREVPLASIAWPEEQLSQLKQGEVVNLFDPKLGQQLYVYTGKNLLELTLPQQAKTSFILYSGVFFLLLGIILAAWIWPLWRDLAALKRTVEAIQPDGTLPPASASKTSVIAPITDALNNMSKQVSSLLKTQRELTGAVAHEFRTPLSRLKFALAIKPAPQSSPWEDMNKDVIELEHLVQEMLDYASMEAQIPDMNMSDIPVKQLCQKLLERLKTSMPEHLNIDLVGDDSHILADDHFVERALQNLLLNASRFANSRILLTTCASHRGIEIKVEDDGPGIPVNLHTKIFEPFFRPDQSRDRKQGGAGLGLAIVKRIQLWHKGECLLSDSKLGGACFTLLYPSQLKGSQSF